MRVALENFCDDVALDVRRGFGEQRGVVAQVIARARGHQRLPPVVELVQSADHVHHGASGAVLQKRDDVYNVRCFLFHVRLHILRA